MGEWAVLFYSGIFLAGYVGGVSGIFAFLLYLVVFVAFIAFAAAAVNIAAPSFGYAKPFNLD